MSAVSKPKSPFSLKLLAVLAVSITMTAGQRGFLFDLVAQGHLPLEKPDVVLYGVTTAQSCVRACMRSLGVGCLSLAYSQEQRECRGYSVFNASDVTVASPGHKYYRRDPGCVGDICATSGNCTGTANTECRNGTCQCVAGYHFYPGPDTCVADCPSGYGFGYYKVENHTLLKNNIKCVQVASEEACRDECVAYPHCRSFDYNGDYCCPSAVTALQIPSAFKPTPGLHYFQRDCA